jgi:hypothetical protein
VSGREAFDGGSYTDMSKLLARFSVAVVRQYRRITCPIINVLLYLITLCDLNVLLLQLANV